MEPDDERILHRIRTRFNATCADYGLIADGDRILIGVSGGKDSLALLKLLAARSKVLKPRFQVEAAYVSMRNIPYQADTDYLSRLAEQNGLQLHVVETSFDPATDRRRTPCFLCSWHRRKALFELAKSLGCNKIALGHHLDDVLVTLLMNETFQGAFGTMPPMLRMDKFDMAIIRPLCRIEERDLAAIAAIEGWQPQRRNCPYETTSHRAEMRDILERLTAMNPEAKHSLWGAMTNVQTNLLPPVLKTDK